MNAFEEIKLLRPLSKMDRAKLIPLLEPVNLPAGEELEITPNQPEYLYFCVEGQGELLSGHDEAIVSVASVRPGDAVGRLHPNLSPVSLRLRAVDPLRLYGCRRESFLTIYNTTPALQSCVSTWMIQAYSNTQYELLRSKQMLTSYAGELWNTRAPTLSPPMQPDETAVSQEVLRLPFTATVKDRSRSSWLNRRTLAATGMIAALLGLHLGLWLFHPQATWLVLALLLWGAINWYAGVIPDYGVALIMVVAAASMGLAPAGVIFSGFTNSAYFLLLGIYGLGAAIQRTGLLYRFALFMLRLLPPTYFGQTIALSLTGLLLTPILPSANGRITIASPLVLELADAMRLPPQSPPTKGLLLATFHGFAQMFFLFMSGGTCLLMWGLLPDPFRAQITWLKWLLYTLPLGMTVFVLFLLVILRMKGSNLTNVIAPAVLDKQLATLGPLSVEERITAITTGIVFLMFVTQPLHGIDAAWPAVVGFILLLTCGIVDRSTFLQKVDWSYLCFFGAIVGYTALLRQVNLDRILGNLVMPVLNPVLHSPVLLIGTICLLTFVVRLFTPWSAVVPLMQLAVTPLLVSAGYHPFVAGMTVLAASNPFVVPAQNILFVSAQNGTNEQLIDTPSAARYGWIHAGVTLGALLLSVPFWQSLHLIP